MSANSKIEWTHHTFNPWWGCTKVSPGCAHCYAEGVSMRWGFDVWGDNANRRFFADSHWNEPLKWNAAAKAAGERQRVFCGSMCDVFEDRVELEAQRTRLWDLILHTPSLDWLLLTKRPENIEQFTSWPEPRHNVWLGTSVENQKLADERIPELLKNAAPVRFLSIEPLLGPVRLRDEWLLPSFSRDDERFNRPDGRGVDWVIVGGESGGGAHAMHPGWALSLRDQCNAFGVPFFFKQWGEWVPGEGSSWLRVGKRVAGRILDGREWNEFPREGIFA